MHDPAREGAFVQVRCSSYGMKVYGFWMLQTLFLSVIKKIISLSLSLSLDVAPVFVLIRGRNDCAASGIQKMILIKRNLQCQYIDHCLQYRACVNAFFFCITTRVRQQLAIQGLCECVFSPHYYTCSATACNTGPV
jgi:hypothetical protein